jgi:type IV pilus assembly protein PilB
MTSLQVSSGGSIQSAISDINREFKEREVRRNAQALGIPYIDLSKIPINNDLLRIISKESSIEANIIPFFQVGKKLRVALTDPDKYESKNILEKLKNDNFILNVNLCSVESLKYAQKNYDSLKTIDSSIDEIQHQVLEKADDISKEILNITELGEKFNNIKPNLALEILNRKAISSNTSDIHIESEKNGFVIRGRIDGTLRIFFRLSRNIAIGIIRQIKFNANIASNLPGLPHDGQYKFLLENRTIGVRVSVMPSLYGDSIVLRYLDSEKQNITLEDLGFSPENDSYIKNVITYREGLVLTTGPTGSGKTTTLYSILKKLNIPEKKIITLENPVEYELPGIIQSSIHTDKGYTFSEALKSSLRQDPDIVLLGEIRDEITASTAMQASMTGHLVLSTLHTNSALDTIIRLNNLNVPSYLISSTLKCIISQRLIRKPCKKCKQENSFSDQEIEVTRKILSPYFQGDGDVIDKLNKKYFTGTGCSVCGNTGYSGRSVVSEVLMITPKLQNMISDNVNKKQFLEYLLKIKHKFLAYDAVLKILKGETDFREIFRVLGSSFGVVKD